MRILFVLKMKGYLRHFDGVVKALAERGHYVRLAAQDGDVSLPPSLDDPKITITECQSRREDDWREHATLMRRVADFARFLTPPFRGATKLRARAFEKLVRSLSDGTREADGRLAELALGLHEREVGRVLDFSKLVERLLPPDERIVEFIRGEAPDLLLLTPLVDLGAGQSEFVKAARALGIPSMMVLFSWDNLSTKGLVHEIPDAVLLWNNLQRQEAIELHGIPAERILVTGAPRFDAFFKTQSRITREKFCADLGLDPSEPIVTYLGSSKFVAEDERVFMQRWLEDVRATAGLERVGIVIKPHPDLNKSWGHEGERVVWQVKDADIKLRHSRPFADPRVVVVRTTFTGTQFLYECLFHSAAAVGLNTSAELEAAVVGRPVLTIRLPEAVADGQDTTLHFHYLLEENGGFVKVASSLAEHCAQLAGAVRGDFDATRTRQFIQEFLRPHGFDRSATISMIKAIERFKKRVDREQGSKVQGLTGSEVQGREPSRDVVTVDYPAVSVKLIATSEAERNWRAHACHKEPGTIEWIERNIRHDSVLYDIGANVGAFALIAARRTPGARVVAFEPGYASFAHLCDNVVLNECQQQVMPIPVPLWDDTGMMTLKYRSLEPGQSRHAMKEGLRVQRVTAAGYHQPVLAFKLDDLVRQFRLPPPTHIKLDVDGAESAVLRGAADTLRMASLESLLIEFEESQRAEVCRLVSAAGFAMVNEMTRRKESAPNYAEFRRTGRPSWRLTLGRLGGLTASGLKAWRLGGLRSSGRQAPNPQACKATSRQACKPASLQARKTCAFCF